MSFLFITVDARTVALEYRDGKLTRTLEAGRHLRRPRTRFVRVDLRESLHVVAPQDILTSDGVNVRVSAAVRWRVDDPVAFVERTLAPLDHVHLATQVALRYTLTMLSADDLGRRGAGQLNGEDLTAAVDLAARRVGVAVLEVALRDVILPAELRAAALELASSRVRGLAQLEAARAETAALRSMANGARLLDAHPALAQLRIVQAAPAGSTIVVRLGDAGVEPPPG